VGFEGTLDLKRSPRIGMRGLESIELRPLFANLCHDLADASRADTGHCFVFEKA
jgi:hypothetical protein